MEEEKLRSTIEQYSLLKSILLHLLPGAALTILYIIIYPIFTRNGWPSLAAFLVAIIFTLIPLELGVLLYQAKKQNGNFKILMLNCYNEKLSIKEYLVYVTAIVIWGLIWLGAITNVVDSFIIKALFSWIPEEFNILSFIENISSYSDAVLLITIASGILITGIIGPIIEELYFRGYLLPRLSRNNKKSVILASVLFSLYHFWQPWQLINRIILMIPWIYIVRRKRSIVLSIIIHVTIGIISMVSILPLVFYM